MEKTRFFDTCCKISENDLTKFLQEYEIKYEPLEDIAPCYSCNELTHFQEKNLGYHVCSIECLEQLDKMLSETYDQLSKKDIETPLLDLQGERIIDIKIGGQEDGREYHSAVITMDSNNKKKLFCDFGEDFLRKALTISDGDEI